jgi:integrase
VSEIVGLQWGDFNWDDMTVLIQRAVVQCRLGETKTETSSRPLPINPSLAARLLELPESSKYCGAGDWVFANEAGKPRWQETILQRQLTSRRPAVMMVTLSCALRIANFLQRDPVVM